MSSTLLPDMALSGIELVRRELQGTKSLAPSELEDVLSACEEIVGLLRKAAQFIQQRMHKGIESARLREVSARMIAAIDAALFALGEARSVMGSIGVQTPGHLDVSWLPAGEAELRTIRETFAELLDLVSKPHRSADDPRLLDMLQRTAKDFESGRLSDAKDILDQIVNGGD